MPEPEQSLRDGDGSVAVSPSFGGKKKRVLLVEEDPLARAFLLSKLRMEGIDVDVAWNGKLAIKKLPGGQSTDCRERSERVRQNVKVSCPQV